MAEHQMTHCTRCGGTRTIRFGAPCPECSGDAWQQLVVMRGPCPNLPTCGCADDECLRMED